MRKTLSVLLLVVCSGWFAVGQTAPESAATRQIDGAWQRETTVKDGSFLAKTCQCRTIKEVKLIGSGRFMWLSYVNGKFFHTGGGTYKIDGNGYTQHIDFITSVKEFLGNDLPVTVEWKSDIEMIETFKMPNGKIASETWKRLE